MVTKIKVITTTIIARTMVKTTTTTTTMTMAMTIIKTIIGSLLWQSRPTSYLPLSAMYSSGWVIQADGVLLGKHALCQMQICLIVSSAPWCLVETRTKQNNDNDDKNNNSKSMDLQYYLFLWTITILKEFQRSQFYYCYFKSSNQQLNIHRLEMWKYHNYSIRML